jgi:hypothetical protein
MRRAPAFVMLLLGCAVGVLGVLGHCATAQAGDKVHTLSAGNLKINGEITGDDIKVRVTNPGNNASGALPAKTYMVKLAAGRYQMDLASEDIDCVLVVQDKTGKQLAFDDDTGKGKTGLDSRLVFQANDDTYKIVAAALDNTGPFTLTIKQLGGSGGKQGKDDGDAGGGGGDAAKPIEGNVQQNDPKVEIQVGGQTIPLPAKVHTLKLDGGKKYQFDLVAKDELDPVVVVQSSDGKQLGFNDDVRPGDLNSRLILDIAKSGSYKVYAASLNGEGKYVLTVKQVGAGGAGGGDQPAGKGLTLKDGMLTVNGSVDNDDPKVNVSIPGVNQPIPLSSKLHAVNLPAGNYQFDIMSTDFDTFLVIQDKNGKQLAFDDDGGEGLNSRLKFQVAKADTYKVFVAALTGAGDFKLTIKSLGKGAAKGGEGKLLDIGVRGARVEGALSREVKSITYRVKLEQGKSYVIEMNSANQDELDPFIEVHDANGQRLAQDDDGAGDLNSRLVFRAPESGTYVILARSFNNSGVGDFTLSVKQQE